MTDLPHQGRGIHEACQEDHTAAAALERIAQLVQKLDRRYDQPSELRIDALDKLTEAKFAMVRSMIESHAEKAALALSAADKAISKADHATEKRFESVNEFRQTLSDQTKSFISRIEFEALRDASAARVADLSSRLDKIEGKSVGLNAGWAYLIGAITIAGAVASLVVGVFLHR